MNLQHILSNTNLSFLIPLVLAISFFLTIGTLVFFVESAIVVRTLVLGRSRPARYLLIGLPLGAAILSYICAMAGWLAYDDWQNSLRDTHYTLYQWNDILLRFNFLPIAIIGLLQSALVVVLFALILYLEKKLLPRIDRPPLWTVVRRQRVV